MSQLPTLRRSELCSRNNSQKGFASRARSRLFIPAVLVLAVSACAVGPDYKTPETPPAQIAVLKAAAY